ncbi:MAG: aminotransferase class I/II-fold pyridoxal phosphate-dependent enzyme [Anaerolineales bacterium]
MDLFDKCADYSRAHEAREAGLYPYFVPLDESEGTEVIYEGRRILMLGSNNYLGLTTDPRVRAAAAGAIERYGTSCTGSRFLNGSLALHKELERRLATFVGKEAALVHTTGYQTNVGTIACLVGRGDVVVADKEDHASAVDGCLLATGVFRRFLHNNLEDLKNELQNAGADAGKLVVVDGVYSMGGDVAPLPEIVELCDQFGARLMVDDAHGMGVMGGGHGTAKHLGVTDAVDLIMGTFSKSFASIGGFIAGDADVVHFIQHTSRTMIFSASLPASNTAAALAALDIMESEPERIEKLWANADKMRASLQDLGFDTGPSTTPIVPIKIGTDMDTFRAWKFCFDAGLYVNAVVSPAVLEGQSLLRTSCTATHTDEQLDRALEILADMGRALGVI